MMTGDLEKRFEDIEVRIQSANIGYMHGHSRNVFPQTNKEALQKALQILQKEIDCLVTKRDNYCERCNHDARTSKVFENCKDTGIQTQFHSLEEENKRSSNVDNIDSWERVKQYETSTEPNELKYLLSTIKKQENVLEDQSSKISKLNMNNLKLSLAQKLVQNRLQEIEDKLSSGVNSDDGAQQISESRSFTMQSDCEVASKKWKKKKPDDAEVNSKVKTVSKPHTDTLNAGELENCVRHYKLNLNKIPFIAGKSTGKSHSLAANFQEVLSLIKSHNSKLCTKVSNNKQRQSKHISLVGSHHTVYSPSDEDCNDHFEDLISQLNDDMMHLRVKYEELQKHKAMAKSQSLNEDLSSKMDRLEKQLKMKRDQLNNLLNCKKKDSRTGQNPCEHQMKSATIRRCMSGNIKTGTHGNFSCTPRTVLQNTVKQKQIELLRDLRELQYTLRAEENL